jgi:hypothetical protein
LYAWRADGSALGATEAFKSGFGIDLRTSPSFANLDPDPELEIVLATQAGVLHVWNIDGTDVPGFPVAAGVSCFANTAIGDVDDNGVLDIVMLTDGGLVHVFDSSTATELPGWPRALTIKASPISPSPALADFDGDGFLEIVVANNGGSQPGLSRVQVYDHLGNVLPGWPRAVGGTNSEASPIVADFSGDGVADVLFGNDSGFLYAWDWHGTPLAGFPITVGDFIRATPFAGDIDGDGEIDLVLTGWDRNVYVWDFPHPWSAAAAQWPTLKHDVHRSGQRDFRFDIAPPWPPTALASSSHVASAWSNDPTIDVAWSGASDPSGIGGYSFVWDTQPETLPDDSVDTTDLSATSPALADAPAYWFHLRTVDGLGQWTATALHLGPFRIDTVAPQNPPSMHSTHALAAWSNDRTIEVLWSAGSDGETPPEGGTRPRREPQEWSPDGESAKPRAAGDQDAPPVLAASGVAGYSLVWDLSPVTVPDSTIETALTNATSPPLADGDAHWFHVRAVDAAGNAAAAADARHLGPFWIDTTPPADSTTVTSIPVPGGWVDSDSLAVHWDPHADAHSGAVAYSWVFDSSALTTPDEVPESAPALLAPPPEGVTWLHVRACDAAGNWNAGMHVGPFQIDRSPPVVTVVAPNGGETWHEATTETIRWHAGDTASGVQAIVVEYSIDGGVTFPFLVAEVAAPDSSHDWTVPATPTATARVRVRATDAAGHAAADTSDADFTLAAALTNQQAAPDPPVTHTGIEPAGPNPFNPTTTLRWSLLRDGRVRIVIYDARGRRVRRLVDAVLSGPHWYARTWDGRDDAGGLAPSGVYFARFEAPEVTHSIRLLLVK